VLDRDPAFRVVADIDLDAIAVGIFVVEAGLRLSLPKTPKALKSLVIYFGRP
jgi:hypothetical protein